MSIHLRSRRGPIGTAWFAIALREALERALGPTRAATGRRAARADAVQWIDVIPGAVRGDVRDADGTIASPRLDVRPVRPDDRRALLAVTARTPDLAARLAGGEYPEPVEQELAAQEVPLLPTRAADISHDCTCHDWPGPCVHVHALACVLIEAVEDDPVLLLRLRGLELGDLAAAVSSTHGTEDRSEGGPEGRGGVGEGRSGESSEARYGETGGSAAGPRFEPTSADAELLVEELGQEAAAVIAAFYGAAPPGSPDGKDGPPTPR
ncbi:hypothetical protein ACT3TZ_02315 [Brachybacterium sp. AOP25-B2-12]|uniref:hypothetical protein n=1 Tax=Brachybacterium sp. AOP25-B2-12 TaxID=3457710 RepID=UPI004033CB46